MRTVPHMWAPTMIAKINWVLSPLFSRQLASQQYENRHIDSFHNRCSQNSDVLLVFSAFCNAGHSGSLVFARTDSASVRFVHYNIKKLVDKSSTSGPLPFCSEVLSVCSTRGCKCTVSDLPADRSHLGRAVVSGDESVPGQQRVTSAWGSFWWDVFYSETSQHLRRHERDTTVDPHRHIRPKVRYSTN